MSQNSDIFLHAEPALFGSSQDNFLQDEDSLSVAELIPQILMQRKSFLHISEAQLEAEIENLDSPESMDLDGLNLTPSGESESAMGTNDFGYGETDGELAQVAFQRQKSELLSYIGLALNETSLSLDFVSLLMSAEKPGITKLTISPHLAKTAPLGSLSADRTHRNSEIEGSDAKAKKLASSVGLGWKYQSLGNVRGLFRDAASQLRGQVSLESTYWRQISEILAHGEVLYKLRDPSTGARALGVQYGYGDSGLTYHDRGRAVLRKNDGSGTVSFIPIGHGPVSSSSNVNSNSNSTGLPINRQKYTRVRILSKAEDDYMVTGQLSAPRQVPGKLVLADIERARLFLFEADLFYHLLREAKNLVGYGVTIVADKIIVDLGGRLVEVESVIYDEENEEDEEEASGEAPSMEQERHNKPAQEILIFLRLMLCGYYQYRLRLKQKMPTLHTKWKQQHSHPLLLRPWLGHTRHQLHVRHVRGLLAKLGHGLDPKNVHHEISESLYANLSPTGSESPFAKAVNRPISEFSLVLSRISPLMDKSLDVSQQNLHLKAVVEVTATDIFVDLILRLKVATYKSKADLEANQGGSNVLLLEFTDLAAVNESLDWTVGNFLDDI